MKQNLLKFKGIIVVLLFTLNSCSDSNEEIDPCKNGPILNVDNVSFTVEGQAIGEITVSTSSGKTPYMYSIDGINFQSSGTFSNLEGGNYTLTVKDANNCTDSKMAFVSEIQEVSYASQIRPLLDTNCQIATCHGDQVGIPSFATYADVLAKASEIKSRTSNQLMPPTGPLPDDEIQLISDWVDQGAPDN